MILLPKPPPVYSLISTTLLGIDARSQRAIAGDGLRSALRAGVNEDLAVLPVSHRGAGLERLWLVSGVTNVSSSTSAAFLKPASTRRTTIRSGGLAHRQSALLGLGEVGVGPLQVLDLGGGGVAAAAWACRRRTHQTLPSSRGVRSARTQADQRIDHERQRLEIDVDLFDGLGRGQFVDGRTARIGSP